MTARIQPTSTSLSTFLAAYTQEAFDDLRRTALTVVLLVLGGGQPDFPVPDPVADHPEPAGPGSDRGVATHEATGEPVGGRPVRAGLHRCRRRVRRSHARLTALAGQLGAPGLLINSAYSKEDFQASNLTSTVPIVACYHGPRMCADPYMVDNGSITKPWRLLVTRASALQTPGERREGMTR